MSDMSDDAARPFQLSHTQRVYALATELGLPFGHDPVDWLRLQIANRDRALELIRDLERSDATVEQDRAAAIKMARDALGKGPTL
jgi:hypothetical protein